MYEILRGDQLRERYERAKKGRDVSLNQTFRPLLYDYTISGGGPAGFLAYNTIHLDLLYLPKINIAIAVSANSHAKKSETITPFEPEQGYQITDEDYSIKQRERKNIIVR